MCVVQHTLQHGQQHIIWSWLNIPNIVQVQMSHVNVRVQNLGYDCVARKSLCGSRPLERAPDWSVPAAGLPQRAEGKGEAAPPYHSELAEKRARSPSGVSPCWRRWRRLS